MTGTKTDVVNAIPAHSRIAFRQADSYVDRLNLDDCH